MNMRLLNDPTLAGCVANAALFLVLLLLINVPAPFLGLNFDDEAPGVALAPPGWLVVTAWLILFPAMGVARWMVVKSESPAASAASHWIVALALLCASYAYYTLGFERLTGVSAAIWGLAGNAAVIVTALFAAAVTRELSPTAASLLAAVAVWTSFASVSVVQIVAKL